MLPLWQPLLGGWGRGGFVCCIRQLRELVSSARDVLKVLTCFGEVSQKRLEKRYEKVEEAMM